ncbi:MAG: hypothetical protein ACTHWA_10715 [Arachnia sp.]
MRIAIFDGILETHLASSLERALVRRGHSVLNTGKVGQGFEFPKAGADLSHLHEAISRVLAHDPEWVIVMRPASLPPQLLRRLKSGGANLAVWLSDDPVLFHLTYAPLLESYDLVLHCGTAEVLRHYETFFGRPTGVNFPFWTDHQAFPYVWGTEEAESTAVFLGNVHDQVRRKRYFSLARMHADVRIHGNVGTDYLNLGGGYLDSDEEVVNAGARAKLAINIPQFFGDHRGLPTWFPGLDGLGFFEYPSRVVQYIAMGLPVISIIAGQPKFESLPEMRVVEDVSAADRVISQLLEGELPEVSRQSEERFARHFSADARVLAFESLVTDDSWRSLDAVERNLWFTQFDGRDAVPDTPPVARERVNVSAPVDLGRVIVLGRDGDRPTSRVAVTIRALARMGADVIAVDAAQAGDLEDLGVTADGLVVCGVPLSHLVPTSLPESAWRVVIDDSSHLPQNIAPLLPHLDAIGVRDPHLHAQLSAAGHEGVLFCPPSVDAHYLDLVANVVDVAPVVRTWASKETDSRFAPAFNSDIVDPVASIQRYSDLWGTELEELARSSRARVGVVGFVGDRTAPMIDEITPFAAAAADVVVIPRVALASAVEPYPSLALQVREQGELASKLRRLATSPSLRAVVSDDDLVSKLGAERILGSLVTVARRRRHLPVDGLRYPHGFAEQGMLSASHAVEPVTGGQVRRTLDLALSLGLGDWNDHLVEIMENDAVIHSEVAASSLRFILLAAPGRALGQLALRLRYVGQSAIAPAERLIHVCATGEMFAEHWGAAGIPPPHTQVWRRV